MDAEDSGRNVNAPAPGVTIKIINQVAPPGTGPTIDITPTRAEPEPTVQPEPIFRLDR